MSCENCKHEYEKKLTAGEEWAGNNLCPLRDLGLPGCIGLPCKQCRPHLAKAYDLGLESAVKPEPAMTADEYKNHCFSTPGQCSAGLAGRPIDVCQSIPCSVCYGMIKTVIGAYLKLNKGRVIQ